MSILPEYAAPTGIRLMRYQMAKLLFTGEDVSADELCERFQRQGWLVRLP